MQELVDERRESDIARAARRPEGDFERSAANVVHRMTGARVVLQDDGSRPSMPDIRMEYPDGQRGFCEVVTDFKQDDAQVLAEIMKQGVPLVHEAVGLERIWFVTVDGRCKLKKLYKQAPTLLQALTSQGLILQIAGEFEVALGDRNTTVAAIGAMGVTDLSSRPLRHGESGALQIYPEGATGSVHPDWDGFIGWLDGRLASAEWSDVRRKLGTTGAAVRAVFCGVTYSSPGDVFMALAEPRSSLPTKAPRLPEEITHVWIMPAIVAGRCLAWLPDRGWIDVEREWYEGL